MLRKVEWSVDQLAGQYIGMGYRPVNRIASVVSVHLTSSHGHILHFEP